MTVLTDSWYDAENHAVSATMSSNTSDTYTYDGKGLRVGRASVVNNVTTTTVHVFSGAKVIAEYENYDNGVAVGSPSREYIYSGAALLAPIDSSGTRYDHQDHLSNRMVEAQSPTQQDGEHWLRWPYSCPGFDPQDGYGGMYANSFITLDGWDIGQLPSGLMGVPTDPGAAFSGSNNTYYFWGLGFGPGGQQGPFGMYFDPTTEGCYGTSASGITCTDNGPVHIPHGPNGLQFSDAFGQTDFPPPLTWGTLLPFTNTWSPFPVPKRNLPQPKGNPPSGPGGGPTHGSPCGSTLAIFPGILNSYQVPLATPLFSVPAAPSAVQGIPGIACSP